MSGELLLHTTEGIKKAKLQSLNLAPITSLAFAPLAVQRPVLACSTKAGALQVWSLHDSRPGEKYPNLHKVRFQATALQFAKKKASLVSADAYVARGIHLANGCIVAGSCSSGEIC